MALPHVSDENKIGQLFQELDRGAMEFLGLNERALRDEEQFHAYKAMAAAKDLAVANGRIERAFVEGLGQLEAVIHPGVYFRMMALHGRDCWTDPDFLKSFQTKNPGVKPKSRSRATSLRVEGRRGQKSEVGGQAHTQASAGARTQAGGIIAA